MRERRLGPTFFKQKTLLLARRLLGCYLVRKQGRNIKRALICETEAYIGLQDKASHASRGRTGRTEVMFGEAARAYIYLIYGMYYCFNIVTGKLGYPAAVLIRAAQPIISGKKSRSGKFPHHKLELIGGPGKVCKYFKIDKRLNNENLLTSKKIWLEYGSNLPRKKIKSAPRIGVDYAGLWKHKPWRFFIK